MKMAVELASELLFIFFIVQARVQADNLQAVGVVGGVVYLSPPLQTQTTTYHHSHWCYGSSLKIAIHENGRGVLYPNGPFKDRLELFPNNTLKISSLQKNDSNTYLLYLEDKAGKLYNYSVYLKVYAESSAVSTATKTSMLMLLGDLLLLFFALH